jgi:hypothetical protein
VNKLLHNGGDGSDPVAHFVRCLRVWDDRRQNTRCEIYKRGVQTFLAILQDRNDPSKIDVSYDVFPIPKIEASRKDAA